jgi:hypothetical protein
MRNKPFEFIIKAANAKSAKDEGVLSEPYEEFEPGELSMVEEWEREFE